MGKLSFVAEREARREGADPLRLSVAPFGWRRRRSRWVGAWLVAVALGLSAFGARAEGGAGYSAAGEAEPPPIVVPPPSPFDQGRIGLTFGAGGGVYGGSSFFALAAGVGYFVVSGLEVGADLTQWFGSDPNVTQLSPRVRYVFHQLPRIKPYVGGFYRHWFFWEGERDFDTLGARLGVVWMLGRRLYLGLGGAYERVVSSCESECWAIYPEVTIAVGF